MAKWKLWGPVVVAFGSAVCLVVFLISAIVLTTTSRDRPVVCRTAAAGKEFCFLERETEDGLNKICYYSCASGGAAITIKSYQVCPVTISR